MKNRTIGSRSCFFWVMCAIQNNGLCPEPDVAVDTIGGSPLQKPELRMRSNANKTNWALPVAEFWIRAEAGLAIRTEQPTRHPQPNRWAEREQGPVLRLETGCPGPSRSRQKLHGFAITDRLGAVTVSAQRSREQHTFLGAWEQQPRRNHRLCTVAEVVTPASPCRS